MQSKPLNANNSGVQHHMPSIAQSSYYNSSVTTYSHNARLKGGKGTHVPLVGSVLPIPDRLWAYVASFSREHAMRLASMFVNMNESRSQKVDLF